MAAKESDGICGSKGVLIACAILCHVAIAIASYHNFPRGGGGDFTALRTGTNLVLHNQSPYANPAVKAAVAAHLGIPTTGSGSLEAGYFYPPMLSLLLTPVALLPARLGYVLWSAISLLGLQAVTLLIPIGISRRWTLLALLLISLNPLTLRLIYLGQTMGVIVGVVAVGMISIRRWPTVGAAVWSIVSIKPQFALVLFCTAALFYGWRRMGLILLFITIGTFAAGLIGVGPIALLRSFLTDGIKSAAENPFNQVTNPRLVSWNHLLFMLTDEKLSLGPLVLATSCIVSCIILLLKLRSVSAIRLHPRYAIVLTACLALLLGQGKGYDLVLVFLFVPMIFEYWAATDKKWLALAALSLAIMCVPAGPAVAILGRLIHHPGDRANLEAYRMIALLVFTFALLALDIAGDAEAELSRIP